MFNIPLQKHSIARRFILYIVLFSSVITIIITALQLYRDYNIDLNLIQTELKQVESVHLDSLTAALWASNTKLLQTNIEGVLQNRDIQYVEIRDTEKIWVKAGEIKGINNIQRSYTMNYLHRNKNINIGNLTVNVSLDGVYQRLYDTVWVILISNAVKTSLVALFIAFLFYRLIARHLTTISVFSEKHDPFLNNEPLLLDRNSKKHDEFDSVVKAINDMHLRLHDQLFEINQQKQYLSQTLNSIGDAVITTDKKGNVTRLNPVAEQLTGWTNEDVQGQSLKTIFPIVNTSTREAIINPVEKVLTTGETVYLSNHTTLIAKDGKEYQIADSAAAIRNGDEILGMVLVFNDVTEQYHMREALHESEQRLRQLAENLNQVFWLGSPDWNEIIYISPAYEKRWGFSAKYLYQDARAWLDAIHPDDLVQVLEDIPKDTKEIKGCIEFREYRIQKKDGEIIWISAKAYPVYDKDGKLIRIAGIAEDITRRKYDEQKLRLSNEKFSSIFHTSPAGITITYLNSGLLIEMNPAFEKIFGYSAEDITNKNIIELKLWGSTDLRDRVMSQLQKHKFIHEPKLEINNKEGSTLILNASFTLIQLNNKDVVMSSFVDITKQIQQEEQLRRSQKMDALGKLTGGIAHDYNNMLGVILGYSELLKDMLSEHPQLEGYVDEISHAGERGAKLTKKLLSFSKNKTSDTEKLDINKLLLGEQHMLEKTLTARIKLEFIFENNLWPVCLDESELEDAILNMCINAMHAIKNNGHLTIETSNIRLSSADGEELGLAAGDYARLRISDTGCGMDNETKEKIFDPFYSTKGDEGTGLGLSQVYGFVNRCHGSIKVDSKLEQGTQFTLYFPRYLGDDVHNEQDDVAHGASFKGKESILIVDDEPALLNLTREILRLQGYQVFCAAGAQQALEIMSTEHVDLLISDVIMPDMDGYALARVVKEKYPKIKIQLASGYSGKHHLEQTDNELSKKLLNKPFTTKMLLEKIQTLLQ
jgi:PAS domain S-box-containing protein